MPTSYEKLSALLKELFQLDQADLDFGIYRSMNQRRDEITRFLDKELLPQVKSAFGQYQPVDRDMLQQQLNDAIQQLRNLKVPEAAIDSNEAVTELRKKVSDVAVDISALENEVYSHLYSFFRRYYDNGDFISTSTRVGRRRALDPARLLDVSIHAPAWGATTAP